MTDRQRQGTHPGIILSEEHLKPANITALDLARAIDVSPTYMTSLMAGKVALGRSIMPKLAHYFGNTEAYWVNLQNAHVINTF